MVLAWLLLHLCITVEVEDLQDRIKKLEAEKANLQEVVQALSQARIAKLESENENDLRQTMLEEKSSHKFHQSTSSSSPSSDLNIDRKVFVGGLKHGVTDEILGEHFQKYGKLKHWVVINHKENKQGRGFGFVTFYEKSSAEEALKYTHIIMGKKVEVKPAQSKGDMKSGLEQTVPSATPIHLQFFIPPTPLHMPLPAGQVSQARIAELESEKENALRQTLVEEKSSDLNIDRKVFVGGLNRGVTDAILGKHFQQYGKLKHWAVILDKETKKSRGFGIVVFEEKSSAEKALKEIHNIKGKTVEVKEAKSRQEMKSDPSAKPMYIRLPVGQVSSENQRRWPQ